MRDMPLALAWFLGSIFMLAGVLGGWVLRRAGRRNAASLAERVEVQGHVARYRSEVIDDIGTKISLTKEKDFEISRDGSAPPRSSIMTTVHYQRGKWDARVETEVTMTSDKTHFHMNAESRTFMNGAPFITRSFKKSFKRDFV